MTTTLRQRMHQDLQLAGLAEGTQKAYLRAVRQMAAHFRKPPDQISEGELREYLVYLKNERQCKPSSLKIAASGHHFLLHPHRPTQLAHIQQPSYPSSAKFAVRLEHR